MEGFIKNIVKSKAWLSRRYLVTALKQDYPRNYCERFMHYNGEGKVNAGQTFEVEDKPGVVPQKQVKCWDVQLRCRIHTKS